MVESEHEAGSQERHEVLNPAQVAYVRQKLLSEQNLAFAVLGGGVASFVGAAVWAAVTVATGHQIGFMAIGVGFLVGLAVRVTGKGVDSVFGVVGGAWSLLGCATGNLLAIAAIVAAAEGLTMADALGRLNPRLAWDLMRAFFSPMDLVFYGIAVYEGYKLSFRRISGAELERMLRGGV